jgi:Uma2 family endonuclease
MTSWDEFQRLPERPENGIRYELHDGEVVVVPPPRPRHLRIQERLQRLLRRLVPEDGVLMTEWPYRPAPTLQYWVVGLACLPRRDFDALPQDEWSVYSPPLIIEALSPPTQNPRQTGGA